MIVYEPTAHDYSQAPETTTKSGLVLPSLSGLYGELRSWIKFRGEPAQTLYCTPQAFRQTWQEYRRLVSQPGNEALVIAACDFTYGLAQYYFSHMVNELIFVGVTHQPKERAKPAPGGIWYDDWEGPKAGVWIE